jgi:hypothetical protein
MSGYLCCCGDGICNFCGKPLAIRMKRACKSRRVSLVSRAVSPVPRCVYLLAATGDTVRVKNCGCPSIEAKGGAEVSVFGCEKFGSCVLTGDDPTGKIRSCGPKRCDSFEART